MRVPKDMDELFDKYNLYGIGLSLKKILRSNFVYADEIKLTIKEVEKLRYALIDWIRWLRGHRPRIDEVGLRRIESAICILERKISDL